MCFMTDYEVQICHLCKIRVKKRNAFFDIILISAVSIGKLFLSQQFETWMNISVQTDKSPPRQELPSVT